MRPKIKKRPPKVDVIEPGFAIGRTYQNVKPPTKKEIERMRQREIIRKNPTGTT